MRLFEKELRIPVLRNGDHLIDYFDSGIRRMLPANEVPIRFAVTRTGNRYFECEIGVVLNVDHELAKSIPSLFDFRKRVAENVEGFNTVLVVPTGIGAEIGGDAGDATPVAQMLASQCDHLITHPNVVNASDINEIPENGLYVEGSVLSRLLMGTVALLPVRSNRVLLLLGQHSDNYFSDASVNSVSAARATLGLDCTVQIIDQSLRMNAGFSSSGRAVGEVTGFEKLLRLTESRLDDFDAVGICSVIDVPHCVPADYFQNIMINPWGGVEALLTHAISTILSVPSAHSPMMENREIMNTEIGIVDARKAAEAVSLTFLQCILKGLKRSPRILVGSDAMQLPGALTASNISCLVIPDHCVGLPTLAALEQRIPVIAVRENKNVMKNDLLKLPWRPGQLYIVDNYWEAAGLMSALRAGIVPESVRRPFKRTIVENTFKERVDMSIEENNQSVTQIHRTKR